MVIVKHVTPHLHDFMVKCVIFHVNQVNFVQEQYTAALIQRKRRSKNRHCTETTVVLPLLLCACYALPCHLCMRCECSNLLTWALEKVRAAYACGVKPALQFMAPD